MSRITQDLFDRFDPSALLVVYSHNNDTYLECAPVLDDGSVGALAPVSKQFMSDLVSGFSEDFRATPHGAVPSNLLLADTRKGCEHYIWWEKPGMRQMFFDKSLDIPDGMYNMPGIVYDVKGSTLSVYCFKGKRPTLKSKLFYGPFYNYYATGKVCLGNATVKPATNPTWQNMMDRWQKIFWCSMNVHEICHPIRGSLRDAICDAADKPFDETLMLPMKKTLQDCLK